MLLSQYEYIWQINQSIIILKLKNIKLKSIKLKNIKLKKGEETLHHTQSLR